MSLITEYLSARGILPQTALDHGFEFDEAPNHKLISQRLNGDFSFNGRPLSKAAAEILWIPVHNAKGTVENWIARPFPTIHDDIRYLSPKGVSISACITQPVWDVRNHVNVPLVVTEGSPKGLALLQAGGFAVPLTGVWMGASCNGSDLYELAHPLNSFAWTSRTVFLAFDADQARNDKIMRAGLRLVFLLHSKGAELMQLSSWAEGEGKGFDDYLVGRAGSDLDKQKEVFAELTAAAVPFFDTLRPSWLALVEAELRSVKLSQAQRSQLCKRLAKRLEVRVSALEGVADVPEGVSQENVYRLLETIEPWPEPVSGIKLVNELIKVVGDLIVVEPQFVLPFVLWAFLVYIHQLFNFSPFIRFKSPVKECGKSTALDILFELAPRPLMVGNMSASPLYRLIPEKHPLILLDEAQSYVRKDSDIGGILDASYQKGRLAVRTNPNTMETEFFDTFGPKALASIGPLTDTIESRSIIVPMTRKRADLEVKQICDILADSPDHFLILRRKLMRWTEDNKDKILATRLTRPAFLGNRNWDKWRPLFTIAHVLGEEVLARLRDNAYTIITGDDSELGIRIEILSMLRDLFKVRGPTLPGDFQFLPTDEILSHLNSNQEAGWADWKTGDKAGLTAKKLGGYLKEYKIKSDRFMRDGKRFHGYWFKDFEKAFGAYLPPDTEPPDKPEDPPPPPDPNPPPPHSGDPGNPPTSQAAESKTGPKTGKTHYTVAREAKTGTQSGQQVVNASGSTIKATRIGCGDPGNKEVIARIETGDPGSFNDSAATTYEVLPGSEAQKVPPGGYKVFFDASAVLDLIERLPDDLPRIALDIETFVPGEDARNHTPKKNEDRQGSALDWQAARIRLISLTVADHDPTVTDRDPVVIDLGTDLDATVPIRLAVERLLNRLSRVEIVGHRLGFDCAFLEHEFGWRPTTVWDTWIAEELLLNDDWELCDKAVRPKKTSPGPTSLESVLARRCGIILDKKLGGGARSDFGAETLSGEQYAYSAGDTRHLLAVADAQKVEIDRAGMNKVAGIEMDLVPIMSHLEIVGVPLREDLLLESLGELRRDIAKLDLGIPEAMQAAGFDPFLDYSPVSKTYLQPPKKRTDASSPVPVNVNGANLKQHYFHQLERRLKARLPRTEKARALQFLAGEAGLYAAEATPQSESDRISLDRISLTTEVLRTIDDPVARLYVTRDELSALVVGIEQRRPFISPDGRVHPVHNQLSANTGRISTEEPPMSNLPKSSKGSPLRRAVEAPDGYVLVQGDLGLIEVRAQAHFTGDPTMIELFNLPPGDPRGDIYRLFASWVEGCPVEQIPAKGPQRNQAKPPVLGTAYLMGTQTFIAYARGYGVDLTVKRADELRSLYFKRFAGIKAWHNKAWENAKANRITEGRSHLGRRRLVLAPVHGDDSHQYRQAQAQVNYIIQAACADGLKIAITLIVKALPEGAELILTVHDELLVLCRTEQAKDVSRIVTEEVIAGYKVAFGEPLKVPIIFETNVIKNWSEK